MDKDKPSLCPYCGKKLNHVIMEIDRKRKVSFEEQDYSPIVICEHCKEQVDDAQQDYILSIIEGVI